MLCWGRSNKRTDRQEMRLYQSLSPGPPPLNEHDVEKLVKVKRDGRWEGRRRRKKKKKKKRVERVRRG